MYDIFFDVYCAYFKQTREKKYRFHLISPQLCTKSLRYGYKLLRIIKKTCASSREFQLQPIEITGRKNIMSILSWHLIIQSNKNQIELLQLHVIQVLSKYTIIETINLKGMASLGVGKGGGRGGGQFSQGMEEGLIIALIQKLKCTYLCFCFNSSIFIILCKREGAHDKKVDHISCN